MSDDGAGFIGFFLVVAFLIWVFDWSPFSDEVTSYSLECSTQFDENGECTGAVNVSTIVNYRVLDERQEVLYWYPDGIYGVKISDLFKLNNCLIINRKNWECKNVNDNDQSITKMIDGIQAPRIVNQKKYVSKFKWWKEKLTGNNKKAKGIKTSENGDWKVTRVPDSYELPNGNAVTKDEYVKYLTDKYKNLLKGKNLSESLFMDFDTIDKNMLGKVDDTDFYFVKEINKLLSKEEYIEYLEHKYNISLWKDVH